MRSLKDILYKVGLTQILGDRDLEIKHVVFDSRKVEAGSLFVAVKGTQVDGHAYIDAAIKKGAVAIICEQLPTQTEPEVAYIRVENSAKALALVASNLYENPSNQLKLIGVTGTNGKTTMVTLLYELFTQLGYKVGMLSTVKNVIAGKEIASTHTTGDAIQINYLLDEMVSQGCDYCFMEVSSHAIHQNRVAGLQFMGMVFTNISHDHLDYHKTFDEYIKVKKRAFDQLDGNAFALTNIDDKRGGIMLQNTAAKKYSYSLSKSADFTLKIIENNLTGLVVNLEKREVFTRLVGEFNAYNLLATYAVGVLLEQDKDELLPILSKLKAAEGRFDYVKVDTSEVLGIVDYAHTPDALENVLVTLRKAVDSVGKIITIVGCGGNRDKDKRPLMGRIAAQLSDRVIFTSDNPRSEAVIDIIQDMKQGVGASFEPKVLTIEDRKEAIKMGCHLAQPHDVILVAGKGHEKYQEIKGVKHPFDDKEILAQLLTQIHN